MPLKISLTKWAVQQFDPPPADRTLRLWVKAGRIIPSPIKIGKTWYVEPTAQHIAEVMAGDRLVNRLRRG